MSTYRGLTPVKHSVLNVKPIVGDFNQEKAHDNENQWIVCRSNFQCLRNDSHFTPQQQIGVIGEDREILVFVKIVLKNSYNRV